MLPRALMVLALLCAGCGASPTGGSSGSPSGSTSASSSSGSGSSSSSGSSGSNSGSSGSGSGSGSTGSSSGGGSTGTGYDALVLADGPVGFWDVDAQSATEPDLTGHGHDGSYPASVPAQTALPNGDPVADFDGATQYLHIPSSASFSIPTTGELTWEGWIRPDVLQFPHDSGGYVDWMGKCEQYAPTCEWEARMYDATNAQNRCDRLSAYAFNPTAGLGSGADWQPVCGLLSAGQWLHVVAEYSLLTQYADCPTSASFPGQIDLWVDGVEWDQAVHGSTGCLSQYSVAPAANGSAVNVGTMAFDTWFAGAIGKVAIYDHRLTPQQIAAHYQAMTGQPPSGSCADTCTVP